MKNEHLIQENQYNFPYHYIPQNKKGFTQNYNWSWGKTVHECYRVYFE